MDWGPEVVKGKSLKMALYENPSENGAFWLDAQYLERVFASVYSMSSVVKQKSRARPAF